MQTRRANNDLILAGLVALAAALLTLFAVDNALLRVLFGLPLVLVVPGYALTAAAFPKRDLGYLERALLSVGLSIAVAIIGGVILNETIWGLQPTTWSLLLAGITLGASWIAWARRMPDAPRAATHAGLRVHQILLFGFAAILLGLALALTQTPTPPQGNEGYTLLWIQPSRDANPNAVEIGINSLELAPTKYALQLRVDGAPAQEWDSIELQPGKTWELNAPLPTTGAAAVEAVLYRADAPDVVYRRVTLTQ